MTRDYNLNADCADCGTKATGLGMVADTGEVYHLACAENVTEPEAEEDGLEPYA